MRRTFRGGEGGRVSDSIPLESSSAPGIVCPGDDVFDKRLNEECLDPGINPNSFFFLGFYFLEAVFLPPAFSFQLSPDLTDYYCTNEMFAPDKTVCFVYRPS